MIQRVLPAVLLALSCVGPAFAQPAGAPAPTGGQQPVRKPPRPPRPPAWPERVFIGVSGGWQASTTTFDDARSFALNVETARFTSDYEVAGNAMFEVGGRVRLWRDLGVGVAATRYADTRDIAIAATLPHPFLFRRDRQIDGLAAGERTELAGHLEAVYLARFGPRLHAMFFGGPSFFTVEQTVVTAIDFAEQFPFDEATFRSATVTTESPTKTGFNVGVDVGYYFTKQVGAGGLVRFSRATVPLSLGDVDAGGLTAGAGLRLKF